MPRLTEPIGKVVLERFRVFRKRTEITIGRLTLLAGANSSGKSSAMLPVLLLKQTLDAPFDPGPLLLTGGHVALASFDDLRSHGAKGDIVVGMSTTKGSALEVGFKRNVKDEISIASMRSHGPKVSPGARVRVRVSDSRARSRFVLGLTLRDGTIMIPDGAARVMQMLRHVLHVPGLRSPPLRDYPLTAVGETFAGRFDPYVASLLVEWQRRSDPRLGATASDLRALGMSWKVRAKKKSDTHVAIEVGRLPASTQGGAHDFVNIADVGVGVSQALPVIVALHQADPGQLVYIEQPELHLHPNAQWTMARILVAAATRGVRVVVETHSSLLILGVQAAIAEGVRGLAPEDVWLHWFERNPKTGDARVTSRTLDDEGAFGDWPADFDSVELKAQAAYLDAVEKRRS